MLRLIIIGEETYDAENDLFGSINDVTLDLEHSLLSVSKWEAKYNKPFLSSSEKTPGEIFGYIKQMVITPNQDLDILNKMSKTNLEQIQDYIDSTQSATTFGSMPESRGPGEVITSELVYYWMVAFNIPFECQTWHLNRLFSLIRICNIKNAPERKRGRNEIIQERNRINAERRAMLKSSG